MRHLDAPLRLEVRQQPSSGGCDDPDCAVPLCWMHHRAYDTGRLERRA